MSNIIEIPRYQSHKQVQALKIKLAIMNPRGVELHFENERFCPIQMPLEFARKHTDGQGVQELAGGYVVWYEDGYTSWSPAEAFEGGYTLIQQHDSDCSTNNRGAPELLGPCDCSVSESKPTCTDERPCVNCFSGQGECEVGPFGGPELLEQARALCQAIERLPAGEHQTNLISKVADATFALQNLQSTGDYFWPRPVAPSLLDTSRMSAEDLEVLKDKLRSMRDTGVIATPVLAAPMLTHAAKSVLAERLRQVEVEGRTPERDDQYPGGQLAFAAIAYLMVGVNPNGAAQWWPWDAKTFKPSPDTRRNLVKAGALLLADIEWLDRKIAAAAAAPDDLTQFLEQTDFDAAEKVASEKADAQPLPTGGEDDCEGCKI